MRVPISNYSKPIVIKKLFQKTQRLTLGPPQFLFLPKLVHKNLPVNLALSLFSYFVLLTAYKHLKTNEPFLRKAGNRFGDEKTANGETIRLFSYVHLQKSKSTNFTKKFQVSKLLVAKGKASRLERLPPLQNYFLP